MPTERFWRLLEAKRQMIREAALQEFARVPYEKVSINQIIHNADISRGSFYTYFEDKDDLLQFVFSDTHEQLRQLCEDELEKNGGDYFAMLEAVFDFFTDQLRQTQIMIEVARNVFSYRGSPDVLGMDTECWGGMIQNELGDGPLKWLYDHIDKRRFRYQKTEEYEPLLMLGTTAVLLTIKRLYDCPEQMEEARRMFLGTLDVLKNGAYRAATN